MSLYLVHCYVPYLSSADVTGRMQTLGQTPVWVPMTTPPPRTYYCTSLNLLPCMTIKLIMPTTWSCYEALGNWCMESAQQRPWPVTAIQEMLCLLTNSSSSGKYKLKLKMDRAASRNFFVVWMRTGRRTLEAVNRTKEWECSHTQS